MRGGDKYNSKPKTPKKKPVPKQSKKRTTEKVYYAQACKSLEKEIRALNNGKIYCFFSGREITERISWHHTNKRIGQFYLDKQWLVPSINDYHIMYHFTPVDKLCKEPWYKDFLRRLRNLSGELYDKELKKFDKSLEFNDDNLENLIF